MPTAFNLKSLFRMCISPFKRFHTVKIHMKVKGLFKEDDNVSWPEIKFKTNNNNKKILKS